MLRKLPEAPKPETLARKVGITPNDLALLRLTNDAKDLLYFRSADGARRYLRVAATGEPEVWYEIVPAVADEPPKEKAKGKK